MEDPCKLAITLSQNNLDEMIRDGKELEAKYAPVILEARVDSVNSLVNPNKQTWAHFKQLLTSFEKTPLIITNTSIDEAGPNLDRFGFKGSERKRLDILQYSANILSRLDRINYISMELDKFEDLNRDKETVKVIVLKHFFSKDWTYRGLENSVLSMKDIIKSGRADIAKVAVLVKEPEEVAYVTNLIKSYANTLPLIALPMGPFDSVTDERNENMFRGIYLTFVAPDTGIPAAPGQPTIIQAREFIRDYK